MKKTKAAIANIMKRVSEFSKMLEFVRLKKLFRIESLLIISRDDWHARDPTENLKKIDLPSVRVIITDTETEMCSKQVLSRFEISNVECF